MKLSVREAASMLDVSETRIYRWIDEDAIPFVMIQHHPMFHRIELLEWAMTMDLPIRVDLYEHERELPLTSALGRGGGRTLDGGLAALVADLPLEPAAERDTIRAVLAARGAQLFVHRPGGAIAVPKAQSPVICPAAPARVVWWWCDHRPLVPGGAPTNAVFVILAPTIKQHLQLLSRLSRALHDPQLRDAVARPGAVDLVIAEVRRWELGLAASEPPATPGAPT